MYSITSWIGSKHACSLFFHLPYKQSSWKLVFSFITGLQNPKCFWMLWHNIKFSFKPQSIPLMIYSIYCFLSFQMPPFSFLEVQLAGLTYTLFSIVSDWVMCLLICFSITSWRYVPVNSLTSHIRFLLINPKFCLSHKRFLVILLTNMSIIFPNPKFLLYAW